MTTSIEHVNPQSYTNRNFVKPKFLRTRKASETVIRARSWVIPDYFEKGELTVLAGPKATGKSTLYCAIAAAVSQGKNSNSWPGALNQEPGGVLIISSEDTWETTIVPRLKAAGADLHRVAYIDGLDYSSPESGRYTFDEVHNERIMNTAQSMGGVSLLVIDPWSLIINGDVKNGIKVQRRMEEMKVLAQRLDVAILMIAHVSKNSKGRDAVTRVSGTAALTDVPRGLFIVAKNEGDSSNDESTHIFLRSATNNGENKGGFSYSIKGEEVILNGVTAHTSKIVWHSVLEGTANQLLSEAEQTKRTNKLSVPEQAAIFLREFLSEGPRSVPEINDAANKAGFSEAALQRAKKIMPITSHKQKNAGSGSPFIWTLHDSSMAVESSADASSEIP